MHVLKTKKVLYIVSNIFSHHTAHTLLPQSFDFHHFTTHIYPSHYTPLSPLPYTALHCIALHFTTLLYTFRWFSLHLARYCTLIRPYRDDDHMYSVDRRLEPRQKLWESTSVYGVVSCSLAKPARPTIIAWETEEKVRIQERDTGPMIS